MKLCDYGRHTIIVNSKNNVEIYNNFLYHKDWTGGPYNHMYIFFMLNGYIVDHFAYKVAYDYEKIRDLECPMTYITSVLRTRGIITGDFLPFDIRRQTIKKWNIR